MIPVSDKTRCCYMLNGEQCSYPGTISHTTLGEGPWYCRWHFQCESATMGEQIIRESRRHQPGPTNTRYHPDVAAVREHVMQQDQASAERYCQERGLHSRQQMLDFMRDKIRTIGKTMREPGADEAEA